MSRDVREESPLEVMAKGAVAGLVGTFALTGAMRAVQRLPGLSVARAMTPDEALRGDGVSEMLEGGPPADPTERLVAKVASGLFDTELSVEARQSLSMAMHWSYGALWGAIFAVVVTSVRAPGWIQATLLGTLVWAVGPLKLIPAMHLSSPRRGSRVVQRLTSVALHQVYGCTTAGAFRLLSRDA